MDENLITALFKFYGTDWLAMVFTILQLYLLGAKKIAGFKFGILGNICWLVFSIQAGSIANILAN